LLVQDPRWQTLSGKPGQPVWRDDYSNLLRVFRWAPAPGDQGPALKRR
jgi:hypothetical protein